jgi:GLPGLI family protein
MPNDSMINMKTKSILTAVLLFITYCSIGQKTLNEGVLVYNMTVETAGKEPKMGDMFDGGTTTIYLKGSQSRSEMVSSMGSSITILDGNTGSGVILNDYSGQKLMITLTRDNFATRNRKYEDITFEPTSETKVIYGYNCKKAIAKLKDGSTFTVYYTTDLNIGNKEYDYEFKKLPGVPLQYEGQTKNMKFKYTISKISIEPVASTKFEIPKSGYRVMTYEETSK